MALILCPECGRTLISQALTCPNCGYEVIPSFRTRCRQKTRKFGVIFGLAAWLFIIIVVAAQAGLLY